MLYTVESILSQKNAHFEIIIKDGFSTDDSLRLLPDDSRIKVVKQKDCGIYDAMNQAAEYASGDYIIYMNSGDEFYDDCVLSQIENFAVDKCITPNTILYGDCYTENIKSRLRYPEEFNDYVCLTKTLCHQATIYPHDMMKRRKFQTNYRIAADYEYYVYAYCHGCELKHIPIIVVKYKGNGASELHNNVKIGIQESRKACKENMGKTRYRRVHIIALIRGFGLKRFLVQQNWFYPIYKKIAGLYYNIKEDGRKL